MASETMTRLADVCQIKPPKKEARDLLRDDEFVSFVPMRNLGVCCKSIGLTEDRPLGRVAGKYTYFAEGDVLLAKITPCFENGKLGVAQGLTNKVGFGSSEFVVLRCSNALLPEFLFYFLSQDAFRVAGATVMTGAVGHKRVPKEFIEETRIPLPPLPEQERIVAILDEAFAAIATATSNVGKNLANARELFESYLNNLFAPQQSEWGEDELGVICSFSSGGTPSKKKKDYWSGDIPWVSGRDMKSTKLADATLHVSQQAVEESSTRMAQAGDLLILVRGMGLAHGAQIAELVVPCAFNQDIRSISPEGGIDTRYLLFALRTRINMSDYVLSNAAHGTLKISMDALKNVKIPVPSTDEQCHLVSQIDDLSERAAQTENLSIAKLTALTELKQSILHKAFSGEVAADAKTADRTLLEIGV